MPDFVKVAHVNDLASGEMKSVEVDGEQVVLVKLEDQVYAFGGTCTHRGGPLGEGELDGDVVTCPWHGGQFNVRTGEVVGPPPQLAVSVYQVRVDGGEIKLARG